MRLEPAAVSGALLALAIAAAASAAVAWAGPIDPPRDRGSHDDPTPTSGGLAIIAACCLGVWLAAILAGPAAGDLGRLAAALGVSALVGLVGAADDLFDFGAKTKLVVQAVLALAFSIAVARIDTVPLGGGGALPLGLIGGALGTALWIVVATNAVNFMDGANGLAAGAVAIAFAALASAAFAGGMPGIGIASLAAAAANLGFLPWNLRGRLFQGDAGALFSGFLFATLCVLANQADEPHPLFIYFGPLALLPFLTDVLLTLLVRARARRPLFRAHREHLYQLWLNRTGKSHGALAWRIWGIMAVFGASAVGVQFANAGLQLLLFATCVAICAVGWTLARRPLAPMA